MVSKCFLSSQAIRSPVSVGNLLSHWPLPKASHQEVESEQDVDCGHLEEEWRREKTL